MSALSTHNNPPGQDFLLAVAKGQIPGHSFQFRVGFNLSVSTTEQIVCSHGADHVFLTSAEKLDFVSDSAEDAVGGDGASTLFVKGLDDDWVEQSETITMTGLTPAVSQLDYLRLDEAFFLAADSVAAIDGGNVGTIAITSHDTEEAQGQIEPTTARTSAAIYSVPAGKTAYIAVVGLGAGEGKEGIFRAKTRTVTGGPFIVVWTKVIFQEAFWPVFPGYVAVGEKNDVLVTAQAKIATVDVDANLSFYLVNN